MLKVRRKRVLVGILCVTLLVSETTTIGFHSYAAETNTTADTGETEEIERETVAGQSEEEQTEAKDGISNEELKKSIDGENNDNPDGQQDEKEGTGGEETESGEEMPPEEQDKPALGGTDSKEESDTEKDSAGENSDQDGDDMPSVSENTESAEEEDTVAGEDYALTTSADDIASGIVDESYGHIEWVIDKNGKLTVSGWGDYATYFGEGVAPWYSYRDSIKSAEVNVSHMTVAARMFEDCKKMSSVDLTHFDVSSVEVTNSMFSECNSLESIDLSGWDTRNVTNMALMFEGCSSLKHIDLSGLDTRNVTSMGGMFFACSGLNSIDLNGLNTGSVTEMGIMFDGCSSLNSIDVSGFDTRNVTIMNGMFSGCGGLSNIDLSAWDTSNVTDMSWMFCDCNKLSSINLNGWDTGNVINMNGMFKYCTRLDSIDLSGFDARNVTNMEEMFDGLPDYHNLTTIYTPYNVNVTYKLPVASSSDIWYRSDGTTVTELPRNLNYSVALGRNYIPTEKENYIYIDEESNHKYQLFDTSMEWEKAKEYCDGLGGHLVTITSGKEQKFVTEIAKKSKKKNIWLGAEMVSGKFLWVTGEKFEYTNWNRGEPNNVNNNQNTIMMYTYSGTNNDGYSITPGVWNDESKQGRNWSGYTVDDTGFICEWDNESTEEEKDSILVFTTEKSLSVKTGDSMWLAFALLDSKTGLYDSEWKKMSVVVSDDSVISLSDYKKTEYGYSLEVIGKKEGATNVVISDTSSGVNITIQINVYDEYVKTYSYSIDNMPSFYPNNKYEEKIETNIYDLNGLYINNYSVQKDNVTNKYKVSFDAYNSNHYYGAVDIYDKDGNWINYEEIEKFSSMTSLWDTGEQLYYLISNSVTGKLLTYEQASFSKCTPAISFEVPEDGYFIISNNVAASPGTFFSNAFDILFDASATVVDLALSDSVKKTAFDDFMDGNKKFLTERMFDVLHDQEEQNEELQKVFLKSMESEIRKTTKKVAKLDVNSLIASSGDMYLEFVSLAEDTINRLTLGDEDGWKQQFKMATGIGESAFAKLSGPAGIALKGCFSINKETDKLSMAIQMALSADNTYVKVFSSMEDCSVNQNGVIINSLGNIDAETVLQVFRISNNDTIEVVLDSNDPLERYELYNICFVKNDQLVQPDGKVTVHLPIPDGMNGDTCKVYRQEEDGSWTILDAHVEGNYLIFETEHFSLYSIVGETKNISIYSLPTNTIYNAGDTLNSEGLVISVDGNLVSKGFICTPSVLSGNGTQTITVIYGCAIAEFDVTVKPTNQVFHVTFNSNGGSFVEEQIVQENESVLRPDDPIREGYRFTGWYKEQSCENKWDFAVDTVQEDITLYAGWTESGTEKLYRVSFDTLNHGIAPEAYTNVKENSRISEPNTPTADGYRFIGWFKDDKCTVRWQFGTDTVTSDITLYAGWVLDDDYGDVLDEDIPASGKIPSGLWVAEVGDYLYTGKPIKPEAHVYDSKTRLKKGQDYTITYKNNTKAGDASTSSKAPTIVVKGKGNYAGTETETFTIQHVSLNDPEIVCDSLTAAYTGKVQKKLPSISYRGKELSNNKDFTVSYPDFSRGVTEAYCAPGTYAILLTAKAGGNYAGVRTVKLTITKSILLSKASVKKIPDQPYTGRVVEPELTVTLQNTPLIKNMDYTVTYMNNKEAGKATAVLSGIGDYAGTKKVTFNIAGTSLKKAKVNKISAQTYNGLEQKPDVSLSVDGISLRDGTDYQITYANNLNAGTGTVTIKGINGYTGSIKKTFRINAYNLKEDTAGRIGGLQEAITCKYLKGGNKPKVELTYAGKKLAEGTDYTLSYKNNKTLTTAGTGKLPTVTITGRGNFKGSISKNFTIVGKALNDKEFPVILRAADKGFEDKPGNYLSRPVLMDSDGKKLAAGKDYDKNVIYMREDGTLLDQTDKLIIGEKVKVKVTGRGAYSGELEATYEMKPEDFSKAKITIASKPYTGSNITLDKDDITVKLNGSNLRFGTDYEIIDGSYTNNMKRGTAEVTIAGKGKYGGMKTVKFKIVSKRFQWFWRLLQ